LFYGLKHPPRNPKSRQLFAHNPISQRYFRLSYLIPLLTFLVIASPTMMVPQHLVALIKTSEDLAIVADNAKRLVSSTTEAYHTQKYVSRPLQPTLSTDTLSVLPRSRLNRTEPTDERKELPSVPPLCAMMKMKVKRCSTKSLSKKLNAACIKNISRWDSGSFASEDSSSECTPHEQQQTLSGLATQNYRNCSNVGKTNSMDKTNHFSLRLPRRQESDRGLDTADMIDKVLGELDLLDSEDENFIMAETATQSRQLRAHSRC
jgi:hypothetical protein